MENADLVSLLSSATNLTFPPSTSQEPIRPPSSSPAPQKRTLKKSKSTASTTIPINTSNQTETAYTLKGVVEVFILLGINSVALWEKTMYSIGKDVGELMNTEVTSLYFNLKLISNAIGSGVAMASDLSQHKFDRINELEREYEELISYCEPIFGAYTNHKYPIDVVKMLHDIVKKFLNDMKNTRNDITVINDSDDDDDDVFKMLGMGFGRKAKTSQLICQNISIRNEDVMRKCITPGEEGKYLIKIEITDCEDLKGVSQDRHWTKVWKKAIFLVNSDKDNTFKTVNKIWAEQAKRIMTLKDVKRTEYEDNEDKPLRKRAKFSR